LAECWACGSRLDRQPALRPFTDLADLIDEVIGPAPILDLLTRAEALGLHLWSDGRGVIFRDGAARVPPRGLRVRLLRHNHTLARLLGDNRAKVGGRHGG
jgi:hypothetical protein